MTPPVTIHFLGTGTLIPDANRSTSATLVSWGDHRLLIDCGFGTLRRLAEAGIDPGVIDAVLLTHFHPDHVGDLVNLFFTLLHHPGERTSPLTLVADTYLSPFLDSQTAAFGSWLQRFREERLTTLDAGRSLPPFLGIQLETVPMRHTPYSIGYRLTINQRRIAFSGDTGACPELVDLCREADLALVECAFPDSTEPDSHMNPSAVGEMAREARVKTLCINHLYPETHRQDPL